jgi:serine protease AprX
MGTAWRAAAVVAVLLLAGGLPVRAAPVESGPHAPPSNSAQARAEVAALPRATAVNDRDGNKIFDDLDGAYATTLPGERLPVIVSFVDDTATADGLDLVAGVAPGAPVRRAFSIIPAYAGDLSRDEAQRVAALDRVRQIELDRDGTPELDTATDVMGADAVADGMGITGDLDGDPELVTTADVGIAVLDTGIDDRHLDLADKLVAWHDFGTSRPDPYDPNSHGTHVASIAAGWGRANPDFRGVAPGASLIGLKIDGGGNTTSNTIAAYEWAVEHRDEFNIRVATISFGFGIATDGTTALERAVDRAWDAGIVCTKSTGNSGPGRSTMTVPAAARGILAIGSLLDPWGAESSTGTPPATKHGFTLSEWSSRGPTTDGRIKPDLVAPGEAIRAANHNTIGGYTVKSGTSMAAPFAAGTAALMIAADPSLEPDHVRDILFATAEDRGPEGPDNEYGYGRIQVWDAVEEVLRLAGQAVPGGEAPVAPRHELVAEAPATGVFETTFTVTDTDFPVAATVISDQLVLGVEILDAAGNRMANPVATANTGSRQHHYTFEPSAGGDYTLRVVVPPGAAFTADLSHSVAAE